MRLRVEADGGSRGNPGPAGYGAVVFDDETGVVLAERAEGIGRASNNVAEYSGLISGLQACLVIDPAADVLVRMDSKLVVEQMSGRWKVKHVDMVPLAKAAAALVRQLGSVRYEWIPRAMNSHADRLANEAMDRQAGLAVRAVVAVPAGPAVLKGFDGDPGDPVSLYWVRHGQTEHSAAKLFSGSSDPELTQLGQRQADAVAERLAREGVTVLLTSPLCRARSTAAAIEARTGLTAVVDERLRETDFGAWEGLSFTEVRRRDGEHLVRWYGDPTLAPPGGESFAQTEVRVRELWQDVVRAHPGARVALVSHVGPIKTAIGIALRAGPSTMHRLHLDLASLCVTEAWPDGHTVLQMANDHAHLWGTHAADPG